jgi:hypothetical protein
VSAREDPSGAVAAAALALAGLAFWLAAPRAEPPSEPCARAYELEAGRPWTAPQPEATPAASRWTRVVGCGGEGDGARALRGPARLLFGARLDANRADGLALEALPGIGPARAAAILRSRADRPFARVADLERVHGIGPRTLARIAPWLEVGAGPGGVARTR